jgi:hypothetical protein
LRALGWTVALAVGLAVCWYSAAGSAELHHQLAWVTLAIGVVVIEMYMLAGLVLGGRRAVGLRRMAMLPDALIAVAAARRPAHDSQSVDADGLTAVVVAGSHLFHRRSCVMAAGREVNLVSLADTFARGLEPCGICLAEVPR